MSLAVYVPRGASPLQRIILVLPDGTEVLAFHWTRDAESGIRRARHEAPLFGYVDVADIRAEPDTGSPTPCAS